VKRKEVQAHQHFPMDLLLSLCNDPVRQPLDRPEVYGEEWVSNTLFSSEAVEV